MPEAITPLNDNSREVTAVASFSAERELNACYIRAVRHNALIAIHRRKRQEPVKPTARARPRTRAHVASAYDEPSLLGGHPPKTRIGRRCTNSKQ